MTIRFYSAWNGYHADQIVSGLANEAALVASGVASYDLDGLDEITTAAMLSTDANNNTVLVGAGGNLYASVPLDSNGDVSGNIINSKMRPEHSAIRVAMANALLIEDMVETIIQTRLSTQTKAAPTGQVWYVRPDTTHNVTRDGTSYATAWGGKTEIIWGVSGVGIGDTLYICGAHTLDSVWSIGNHGATQESERVTVRGDYAVAPGSFTATGNFYINANRAYTTLAKLTVNAHSSSGSSIYVGNQTGIVIEMCKLIGGQNGIVAQIAAAFTSFNVLNNEIYGQSLSGFTIPSSSASIIHAGITATGNYIHDIGTPTGTAAPGLKFSIESGAFDTGGFSNLTISDNVVARVQGLGIHVRCGNSDTTTPTVVFGTGVSITRNWVTACGRAAGIYGGGGGITVAGLDSTCSISNNHVWECYVTGGGIQTAKGNGMTVYGNVVHDIYAGTATGSYQDGFPIDANGIFIDNIANGHVVYENLVFNFAGTGQINSGVGLAFWDCVNSTFRNNIVVNAVHGMDYGAASESGNTHYGNVIVDCTNAIWKVGTNNITHTMKGNQLVRCTNVVAGGSGGTLITS